MPTEELQMVIRGADFHGQASNLEVMGVTPWSMYELLDSSVKWQGVVELWFSKLMLKEVG